MKIELRKLWRRLSEGFQDHMREKLEQSWCISSKADRKHRLRTITTLCIELERIKSVDLFSTATGEQAIEKVIEGDWSEAEDIVALLSFKNEDETVRARYEPLWADFVVILRGACRRAREMQEQAPQN